MKSRKFGEFYREDRGLCDLMAEIGERWRGFRWIGMIGLSFILAFVFAFEEQNPMHKASSRDEFEEIKSNYLVDLLHFLWRPGESNYKPIWPV